MARYLYPAVFEPEPGGAYSVFFPDIEGCYTAGEDLTDAFEMAADALTLTLNHLEAEGRAIPAPSSLDSIQTDDKNLINYIFAAT